VEITNVRNLFILECTTSLHFLLCRNISIMKKVIQLKSYICTQQYGVGIHLCRSESKVVGGKSTSVCDRLALHASVVMVLEKEVLMAATRRIGRGLLPEAYD
jgi:hypothetical protein